MRKIKIIEDGNFSRWVRLSQITIGFCVMYCAFKYIPPSIFGAVVAMVGLGIAAVGGMASRAAMLNIKPFDNSYKKARASYEVKDGEEDQSK